MQKHLFLKTRSFNFLSIHYLGLCLILKFSFLWQRHSLWYVSDVITWATSCEAADGLGCDPLTTSLGRIDSEGQLRFRSLIFKFCCLTTHSHELNFDKFWGFFFVSSRGRFRRSAQDDNLFKPLSSSGTTQIHVERLKNEVMRTHLNTNKFLPHCGRIMTSNPTDFFNESLIEFNGWTFEPQ